jgi:hypothetical protein
MKQPKSPTQLLLKKTRKRSDRKVKNLVILQDKRELQKQLKRASLQNKYFKKNPTSFQKKSERVLEELFYLVIDRSQEILLVSILSFTLVILFFL